MLKAVIFDMDGVLIDSEPIHYQSNVTLLKRLSVEFPYDYYKKFIGSTCSYMWECIARDFNLDKSPQWLNTEGNKICEEIVRKQGYPPVKGAKELVKSIWEAGYKLAVASSSALPTIRSNMEAQGLTGYFDELVSGEDVENPKPAPDVFIKAAKMLGVSPNECLVIEDSRNGVLAAKAADMTCLGFINPNSGEQNLDKADYLTESFEEMDASYLNMIYCHSHDEPCVIAENERIYLREMMLSDIDRIYEIYSEPEITRYMEGLFEDKNEEIEFTKSYIENMYKFYEYGMWTVCLKDGTIIGRAGLCHREVDGENQIEVGYVIAKEYQRRHYALEAVELAIEYGRKHLGLNFVNAFVIPENLPSIKLLEKIGFDYICNMDNEGKTYSMYRKNI